MKKTKNWLIPLIVATLLFILVRPTFAQIVESQANLAQYLTANNVEVGSEQGNHGFRQIYYLWNGQKNFITNGQYTSADPVTEEEHIAWMSQINGVWQVFLYHIPSDTTIQLSRVGNNVNPRIDKGRVVWERYTNGSWQIFFFDGVKSIQLTEGDLSLNPDIDGDYITYGRKDLSGTWRAVLYSISRNEEKEITVGIQAKKPKIKGNKIILAGTGVEEEFPLTVDDLFLLNLAPLSTTPEPTPSEPETVTEEEVRSEIEAISPDGPQDEEIPSGSEL